MLWIALIELCAQTNLSQYHTVFDWKLHEACACKWAPAQIVHRTSRHYHGTFESGWELVVLRSRFHPLVIVRVILQLWSVVALWTLRYWLWPKTETVSDLSPLYCVLQRIACQLMDTRNKLVIDVRTITKELNWGLFALVSSGCAWRACPRNCLPSLTGNYIQARAWHCRTRHWNSADKRWSTNEIMRAKLWCMILGPMGAQLCTEHSNRGYLRPCVSHLQILTIFEYGLF